ncbi:endopeptidase La [Clostridium paridis]|uniref:Lon protease n=1 Tax=Clostridium paridis TaxID=2803863 RepID=A0A937FHI3_9CLOT|nr:endopeptidase La [Clostridium paridis]MBL4932387.1 endopeptidase La [Clostridium paridis]
MGENVKLLPLIPLRGITIFPNMVIHFDVGREKSIAALEEAMLKEQEIFLVSQKDAKVEEPGENDIYEVGTICIVKQLLKLPGDVVRVLVEGIERGKILKYLEKEEFLQGEILSIEDDYDKYKDDPEFIAALRSLRDEFGEFLDISNNKSSDEVLDFEEDDEPGRFADIVASYLLLKQKVRQEILEAIDLKERIEKLLIVIKNEIEVLKLEKKIGFKVKKKIDKLQKEYYLREQLKIIQEELGEDEEEKREINKYEELIKKAKLPKEVKEKASYELTRLKNSSSYSQEGNVIKTYLDWVLGLPWNKFTKDNLDLVKAKDILDEDHYGLKDVKERIIEYLAVKKMSQSLKGPILCLVGPPGVGKSSIAKSVARALNRNFVRISLGGIRDEAEIRGHRKTYVGAIPGRIVYGMKNAKSNNPLFLLDEIDKLNSDFKGDPSDALLEVLDSAQNSSFRDNYLELDMDLSKVMFITTANSLETIPRPLLDRMEVIEVSGYTYEEKFNIAKKYLIPRVLVEHNVKKDSIKISDGTIEDIIEYYTRESGVRNLERRISTVIRRAIREMMEKDKKTISITSNNLQKYLGTKIYTYDKIEKTDRVGVVTGMAWTAYGGDTLPVEVMVMKGSGKLELTGQLGDVMKESAKAAYSYVRGNTAKYGINDDFYKKCDVHVHVPEGAVPKDGPSAGVTLITALVSALANKKVKHNVAMTGEITLTGKVLAIGGLKEKSLAAYRAGIDTVIVPKQNERDLDKIPKSVKNKIKFIFASRIEEVLENALVGVE